MKEVGIPGSKFILCLEDDQNQWFLRLRINHAIEEELPLTHLEKKTLRNNIEELLTAAHLNLNEVQITMIHSDIWGFIENKLNQDNGQTKKQYGTIEDPRFDMLVARIDKLKESIEGLESRISKQEMRLT